MPMSPTIASSGLDAYAGSAKTDGSRQLRGSGMLRPFSDRNGAFDRAPRVVGKIHRHIEKRMRAITDDLVHHSAMRHDDGGDAFDIVIQDADQCLRSLRGASSQ